MLFLAEKWQTSIKQKRQITKNGGSFREHSLIVGLRFHLFTLESKF